MNLIFTLSPYTLLNGTVFYEARWYRLSLKIDNATNVEYFVGQGVLSPQMPRSFTGSVTVRF